MLLNLKAGGGFLVISMLSVPSTSPRGPRTHRIPSVLSSDLQLGKRSVLVTVPCVRVHRGVSAVVGGVFSGRQSGHTGRPLLTLADLSTCSEEAHQHLQGR